MISRADYNQINRLSLHPFRLSGSALAANRFVRIDSDSLALAGASDDDVIAVTSRYANDSSHQFCWLLGGESNGVTAEAGEAIELGATVYAGASGRAAATGTVAVGRALTRASGSGDTFRLSPFTTA